MSCSLNIFLDKNHGTNIFRNCNCKENKKEPKGTQTSKISNTKQELTEEKIEDTLPEAGDKMPFFTLYVPI